MLQGDFIDSQPHAAYDKPGCLHAKIIKPFSCVCVFNFILYIQTTSQQ